jgi:(p)ppGpp synthase/HD superfamily hydrolase
MNTSISRDTQAQPVATAPIDVELNQLHGLLDNLAETISTLGIRLTSVSSPATETATAKSDKSVSDRQVSPTEQSLLSASAKVSEMRASASYMLAHLRC